MLYILRRMIVTYAGAAAAEFSSRAVPAILQTLGFTDRYIARETHPSSVFLFFPSYLES